MRTAQLFNLSTGRLIAHQLECADTSLTRVTGLLGRRSLAAGEGLWIKPSSGIHTVGMRFPIDVVGLDAGLRIVKLWHNLRPNRVPWPRSRIRSVVELAAGEIAAHCLRTGQALTFSLDATSS